MRDYSSCYDMRHPKAMKNRLEGWLNLLEYRRALMKNGYTYHHTAIHSGYVSRLIGVRCERYSGRFGVGFKVMIARWDSSRKIDVEYYIAEDPK